MNKYKRSSKTKTVGFEEATTALQRSALSEKLNNFILTV